jgi:hypothetical protein
MATGEHTTQGMASALTFLERYHKDGDEFLSNIVRVTGVEIWVSFVNVETRSSQSSGCTHIHQTSRKSLNKPQETDSICFLSQERGADGGIHATRDHSNVRSVLRNTKEDYLGSFRAKGIEC